MKKNIILLTALLFFTCALSAQYNTVVYNYEKNVFNQGAELPAETNWMLNAAIQENIDFVSLDIYRPGNRKKPLYTADWKRTFGNSGTSFDLPVNYKLRSGDNYDFILTTFRKADGEEKQNLQKSINSLLDSYVDAVITAEKKRLSISKPAGAIINDLNDIVHESLGFYRNNLRFEFPGFSDIVKLKINQLRDLKLKNGIVNVNKEKFEKKNEARQVYAQQLKDELKTTLHTELEQMLNLNMVVLNDIYEVRDYAVEKKKNVISLNAGYGGVYFDGGLDNLSYDAGPYVGVSLPFGRSAFSSPFWANSSLNFGVFLRNFEDENGNTVTGPILGRPYYAGLGYKVFQFIRLNAGATLLEEKKQDQFDVNLSEIKVRPFIGISAEINLWVGLGKK